MKKKYKNNYNCKWCWLTVLIFIWGLFCIGDSLSSQESMQDIMELDSLEHQPEDYFHNGKTVPFGVGERLRFNLDFSLLNMRAGYSEMSVVSVDTSFGSTAYYFRSRVKSTKGVDWIYKVRDQVESWFDLRGLYSHRFEKRIREGGFRSQKFFDYNHNSGWASISNENGPKGIAPFTPYSHNIISALFWVRCQELQEGKDLYLELHDIDKQYPLAVKVYGLETVKVPAGTFECWKVEPVVRSEGLFNATDRLWVWITNDENRLPIMMRSEISVGAIVAKLTDYRLGIRIREGESFPEIVENDDWEW